MPKIRAASDKLIPPEAALDRSFEEENDDGVCQQTEELETLLRCYHEILYQRLDRRLEAAQDYIVEQMARAHARERVVQEAIPPCLVLPGRSREDIARPRLLVGPAAGYPESALQEEAMFPRPLATVQEQCLQAAETCVAAPSTTGEHTAMPSVRSGTPKRRKLPVFSTSTTTGSLDDHDKTRKHKASALGQDVEDVLSENDTEPESPLRRLVQSVQFDCFFGVAILSNAVFMGVQTDYTARNLTDDCPMAFYYTQYMFTAIFTVELLLRMANEKMRFFRCGGQWYWNYLDTFIVTSLLGEMIMDVVLGGSGRASNQVQGASQVRIMRVLRIMRSLRIIRIVRIIRFVRAVHTLVDQIMSTVKSLVWAILLLGLVIFLFGNLFTQAVAGALIESGHGLRGAALEAQLRDFSQPLQRYWSTLPRSMFTLYKAVTGGVSWHDVVTPLSDVHPFWVLLFVAYISFAQLAVLNVLTGVFCQNAIDSAQRDQDLVTQAMLANKEMYVNQIKQIFTDIDVDNSGSITIQEFEKHLTNDHVRAYLDSLELDTSDVWTLFKLMDADEGNVIDLEEFVMGCLRLKGNAKGVDMAKLSYEHRWMARRMAKFMKRTDEALAKLTVALPGQGMANGPLAMAQRNDTGSLEPGAFDEAALVPAPNSASFGAWT